MSRRSVRTICVVVGFILVVGVGGYFFLKKYKPQLFDREAADAAQLEALKSAPLMPEPQATADLGWPQWFGPTRDGRAPEASTSSCAKASAEPLLEPKSTTSGVAVERSILAPWVATAVGAAAGA